MCWLFYPYFFDGYKAILYHSAVLTPSKMKKDTWLALRTLKLDMTFLDAEVVNPELSVE